MLIAQTTAINSPGNSSVSILWWLLPLAVAIIWIGWFFRANKGKSARDQLTKAGTAPKSKRQRKSSASNDRSEPVPVKSESLESSQPRTTGKNNKKKEKNKGNRKNKPTVPNTIESVVNAKPPAKKASDKSGEPQTPVVNAANAVSLAMTGPKPSNAIFEPLREVLKERRKATVVDTTDSYSVSNESRPRENDAFNQIFGGKFERIVPKATIRSVANRWPVAAAQQIKSSETITPRQQPITQPNTQSAPQSAMTPNVSPESAPAKGLKSFVSKVKSSTGSDTEPTQNGD